MAALCFGTTGTSRELADIDGSSLSVGMARIVLGGALLALCAWWTTRRGVAPGTPPPVPGDTTRPRVIDRVPLAAVVVVGALGVLAYQPTFFLGTSSEGVAVGTVVALGSAPVFTGLLDAGLRGERPTPRWCVATALALVGVGMIAGLTGAGAATGAGVAWSLGAGASYAVYAVASKELLDRGRTPARAMGELFGGAALGALPVLVLTDLRWLASGGGIALAVWLGVVTTAAAYLLFGWGLARLRASTVATLTLAEPLCATLLGIGVLGERLDATAGSGLLVLTSGLVLLASPGRGRRVAVAA